MVGKTNSICQSRYKEATKGMNPYPPGSSARALARVQGCETPGGEYEGQRPSSAKAEAAPP